MSEYGIVPKQRDPGGWRLDTFGALRLALSRAFPPPEAANFRRFAAQRVKPAGEQFGTMPLVPLAALLTPHASPPTWHRPHDRRGGARRRCPTPIWVQHSQPFEGVQSCVRAQSYAGCKRIGSWCRLRKLGGSGIYVEYDRFGVLVNDDSLLLAALAPRIIRKR